jgi:MFS transporter, DHA1 family, multidrug resistance protein
MQHIPTKMKMKPGEFIALSACTMMLTALGIDIMLPALAELRKHFGLSPDSTETAKIISYFFMGQITQIILGPISDRFGRLFVLRIGFPLYIFGGISAAFAPSLPIMFAARFVAGMGAAAVLMTTIAGVRDRFVGNQMAHIMSLVLTLFLFTPVLAPFLGLAILAVSSWQAVFLTPPIFAVLVFLWSLRLEESLLPEHRIPLGWKRISRSLSGVLGNRTYLRYVAITTLLFTALSSYVASSEHIIGEIYHKPKLFPWIFGGIGLFLSLCTLINSRLTTKFGARRVIKWLLFIYTGIGSILFTGTLISGDPPGMLLFFIMVGLLLGLNLAIEPNSSALALEPMGKMAGMASAVYGTSFFFIGSSIGSIISHLMRNGVLPLVLSFFVFGLMASLLVLSDRQPTQSGNLNNRETE